jgi:Fic family protein/DNA-binding Xre family transcriptional regulator
MNLQEICKQKGYKVHEIAQQIGIDSSLMSRILAGKRKPTALQMQKIAVALELSHSDVLTHYLSQEIVQIVQHYPQLAPQILHLAEERVSYLLKDADFESAKPSKKIKTKLAQLDELLKAWQTAKPLDALQLEKMQAYFHTAYTYESNRIEGNTLTLQETHLVINEGITIGGKSMQEHLEAVNHQQAIHFIKDLVQDQMRLNSHVLKQIHQLILKGIQDQHAGKYRSVPVLISGSKHVPPAPYLLDKLMEDYFLFYEQNLGRLHPVILAAEMHERLVTIHPFIDGNGRTARLVMNLILWQNGFTTANIKGGKKSRLAYYNALEKVQLHQDATDFQELVVDYALASLKAHLELVG